MIINSKSRYNINGFVEELPQLPDVRQSHACAALPTNRVSQKDNSCCTLFLNRHLLLLEAKIQRATNLLWWFYPLEQVPGLSLPLCPGLWHLLQLLLLEEDSAWLVVVMELPTNLRWSCVLLIRQKQKENFYYLLSILKKGYSQVWGGGVIWTKFKRKHFSGERPFMIWGIQFNLVT